MTFYLPPSSATWVFSTTSQAVIHHAYLGMTLPDSEILICGKWSAGPPVLGTFLCSTAGRTWEGGPPSHEGDTCRRSLSRKPQQHENVPIRGWLDNPFPHLDLDALGWLNLNFCSYNIPPLFFKLLFPVNSICPERWQIQKLYSIEDKSKLWNTRKRTLELRVITFTFKFYCKMAKVQQRLRTIKFH